MTIIMATSDRRHQVSVLSFFTTLCRMSQLDLFLSQTSEKAEASPIRPATCTIKSWDLRMPSSESTSSGIYYLVYAYSAAELCRALLHRTVPSPTLQFPCLFALDQSRRPVSRNMSMHVRGHKHGSPARLCWQSSRCSPKVLARLWLSGSQNLHLLLLPCSFPALCPACIPFVSSLFL